MTEEWRPVPGWEGFYAVSDHGRVKGLARSVQGRPGVLINKRESILKFRLTADGYSQTTLTRDNKRTTVTVHRLVALAFIGPVPQGQECCHIDGIKTNNSPDNIRYGTRSENTYDKVRHGAHPFAKRTHCPQGHPYNELNTYVAPRGSRGCRTCRAASSRARHEMEKAS